MKIVRTVGQAFEVCHKFASPVSASPSSGLVRQDEEDEEADEEEEDEEEEEEVDVVDRHSSLLDIKPAITSGELLYIFIYVLKIGSTSRAEKRQKA